MTHETTLSHAAVFTTPDKKMTIGAEVNPSAGTWKVLASANDWSHDLDVAMEIEYKNGREGMASLFNFGCRRHFVGGSHLTAALSGFSNLRINLELPFGGQMPGVNQMRLLLSCLYETRTGKLRQGLSITA